MSTESVVYTPFMAQRQTQAQAPLLQVPTPNFPWTKHAKTQLAVQSFESHVEGPVVEQLPPTQVEPGQSASVQHE
jgi:hypothetical protein